MPKPSLLSDHDRELLGAIKRDRDGIDTRIAEIAAAIMMLDAERAALRQQRDAINDGALADKFGVSRTAIHYLFNGRPP
jgi:hypothetical protein